MTTIYNYHPATGEYLSQAKASLDPLEGKPLVPSFATTKKPPAVRENEIAVFKDDAWSIISDYRGTEYWLADGSVHTIEEVGEKLPKEALDAPPAPTLDELKAQAKEKVLVFASDTRAKVAGQVDQYKLAGWNDKSQRAQRVLAGNASEADIAILQAECDQRGHSETPEQLAATQAKKGQALAMAVAVIDGMEDTAMKSVEAATSENALEALLEELEAKATVQLSQLVGG